MQQNAKFYTKVLVTGAAGLVGREVVKALQKKNYTVKALFHHNSPAEPDGATWIKGDILDTEFLQDVMQDVDAVVHCAAIVSFNPKRRKSLYKVNIEGTCNIGDDCLYAGVIMLVHISSVEALARRKDDNIIDEQLTYKDDGKRSMYGLTKHYGEKEVWRGIGEGLNAVIINPSIILGGSDWNNGSTELFKSVYNQFPWYTQGINGFVDVQDVAKAIIMLLGSDISGERFIMNAESVSYQQLFNMIAAGFQKNPPHKKVTPFLSSVVWRAEAIKSLFTGKAPMITKETADTAMSVYRYDNSKLKEYIPSFEYTPLAETVDRICGELKEKYNLTKSS